VVAGIQLLALAHRLGRLLGKPLSLDALYYVLFDVPTDGLQHETAPPHRLSEADRIIIKGVQNDSTKASNHRIKRYTGYTKGYIVDVVGERKT
jgi:hypothetical protein